MEVTQPPALVLSRGQAKMVGEAEVSFFVLESEKPLLAFSLTVVMFMFV